MKRLLLLFFVLALMVIVPFLIWGDSFEKSMSLEEMVAKMRAAGDWAWLVGIGLLVIDLFLPILGTVVMSALGLVYGWVLGGLISAIGSILSGLLAYGLSVKLGRRAGRWLAGEEGILGGSGFFAESSGAGSSRFRVGCRFSPRWWPALPAFPVCRCAGSSRLSVPAAFQWGSCLPGSGIPGSIDRFFPWSSAPVCRP